MRKNSEHNFLSVYFEAGWPRRTKGTKHLKFIYRQAESSIPRMSLEASENETRKEALVLRE